VANYVVTVPITPGIAGVASTLSIYVVGVVVPGGLQITPAATGLMFSPTPVPVGSTGLATFTATATAPGTYSISFTNNGALADPAAVSLQIDVGCFYASQTDLETRWGTQNIATWSDTDSTGSANETRIQAALTWAANYINSSMYGAGIWTVQNGSNLALGPYSTILCNQWCCVLAAEWLYLSRGLQDEEYKSKIEPAAILAKNEIHTAAWGRLSGFDAVQRWPQTDGGPIAHNANDWGTAPAPGPG
jgi:phage gp36-like protein